MQTDCPHCSLPLVSLGEAAALCSVCGFLSSEDGSPAAAGEAPRPDGPGDRFELLERIGAGSFSTVWRARDRRLNRMVALKVLHPGVAESEEARARFLRETQTVAQLRHPGIVAVHEVLKFGDRPVMVTNLVQGVTLDRLRAGRRLEPREAAQLVRQAAEALDYAHSMGVVHRDVKPANMMVESAAEGPRLMVLDFGLALAKDAGATLTTDGQLLGTPAYMSPEQALGTHRDVDARSDIYSLGVVLYELLTGLLPFRGGSASVLQQLIKDEPRAPRLDVPHLPRDLESICLKAMAKSPRDRYATARALAEDLGRYLDDAPVLARPLGAHERLIRWTERNRLVATLTAGIGLLLAIVAIVAVLSNVRLDRERRTAMENLYRASLQEAEARRLTTEPGRHFAAMRALDIARAERGDLAVRNAVAATLPLVDAEREEAWRLRPPGDWQNIGVSFDAALHRVAISNANDSIRVLALPESTRVAAFPGGPHQLAISPDGRFLLAYSSRGHPFYLYDVDGGVELATGMASLWGSGIPFSLDSHRAVMALMDGTFAVYDLPSGREIRRVEAGCLPGVFFLDGGARRVAYRADDGSAPTLLLDLDTGGRELLEARFAEAPGAFSPDGRRLAQYHGDAIEIVDLETMDRVALASPPAHVGSMFFNPRGDLLATSGWGAVTQVWDIASGREVLRVPGHFIGFSRDGARFAIADGSEEVGVWRLSQDPVCRSLRIPTRAAATLAELSRDGNLLLVSTDDGALLLDRATGRRLASFGEGRTVARFDSDETGVLSVDTARVSIWPLERDVRAGRVSLGPPRTVFLGGATGGTEPLISVESGRAAYPLRNRRRALIVDFATGDTVSVGPHIDTYRVAISPDGRWVATNTGLGENIRVWNVAERRLEKEIAAGHHARAAFSRDGRWLATASIGFEGELWRVPEFTLARSLPRPGSEFPIYGDVLAVNGPRGELRLEATETGRELVTLRSPLGFPTRAHSSRDEMDWLISLGGSPVCELWDLRALRVHLRERGVDWKDEPAAAATAARAAGRTR